MVGGGVVVRGVFSPLLSALCSRIFRCVQGPSAFETPSRELILYLSIELSHLARMSVLYAMPSCPFADLKHLPGAFLHRHLLAYSLKGPVD